MNLINGEIYNQKQSDKMLDRLHEIVLSTRQKEALNVEKVIEACDQLAKTFDAKTHLPILTQLGVPEYKAENELKTIKQMLSRDYLKRRMAIELGDNNQEAFKPLDSDTQVMHRRAPLGVILHIVAGNVDALPVFSVIEGLLTGNINIVKLPGGDNGLSVALLQELIRREPTIADYVMAFDYPSQEIESIKKMVEVSDAVVVWGGDAAVSAVREMVSPNIKLIEWGHKISFAYVSGEVSDEALAGIAFNKCDTNQMFCSSCQGIYLDTESFSEVKEFALRFSKILDKVSQTMPMKEDSFLKAQKTIECYTEELESLKCEKYVLKGLSSAVIAYNDSVLNLSYQMRTCWIKPLSRNQILHVLHTHKNHLQTAALLCDENRRPDLEAILLKTGIVRITSGEKMSVNYCGMPHDGEFALQRYTKMVSIER